MGRWAGLRQPPSWRKTERPKGLVGTPPAPNLGMIIIMAREHHRLQESILTERALAR